MCGDDCSIQNPCLINEEICQFGGICVEQCTIDEADYRCDCARGYVGKNCTEVVS